MSAFFSLLKTNLNLNFGISAAKYRYTRQGKSIWELVLIIAGIVVGACPLLFAYTMLSIGLFQGGKALNQPEMVLTFSFLFTQIVILILGIFYVMGAFYFTNDFNMLVPLPLKPYEVLGSKLLTVMVNECLTAIPLLLPPLIVYGAGTGQNIFYWLKGIILLLLSPAIPILIAGIFMVVLMRVVNIRRSKDLLAIVGGFLAIFLALGINLIFTRIPEGNEEEYLNSLLKANAGIVKAIGSRFPPSLWATFGLSAPGLQGFLYFLLFIGVSLALFAAILWLGNRFFYKSILSGQEVSKRRKALSADEMNRRTEKTSSPVFAVYMREWRILLRTPVYVLNGLAGSIIGPFLLVFIFIMQKSNSEGKQLLELLTKPDAVLPAALVGLALMVFTVAMNVVASTSVSREGGTFWVAKMIPVSAGDQVKAKLLNAFAVSAISVIVTAILLVVFTGMSPVRVFIISIIALTASIVTNALNLMLDIIHPKLVWNSPQEAMKQNVNAVLGMLVSTLYGGLLAIPAVILTLAGTPEPFVYLVLLVLAAGTAVPSVLGLFSLAERQYAKLEA